MMVLKGIPGAPGIASGPVVFYEKRESGGQTVDLETARKACLNQVRTLYNKTLKEVGEEQAKIFSAYEMLLEDEMLFMPMREQISGGADPIKAVLDQTEKMSQILGSKGGEYMRQRAEDIRYIGEMLASAMKGEDNNADLPEGDTPFLLVARELTPVDTMKFDPKRLAGLATELGGATSHTVILAKSLGIPAIVGMKELSQKAESGVKALMDGYTGELVFEPDEATANLYEKRIQEELQLQQEIDTVKQQPAQTQDGQRISVCINIGKPLDLKGAEEIQYDGVGLFRSEFLYSAEQQHPSVEKQTAAYRKVIEAVAPNQVIIRTLDVGGDKELPYLSMPKEENPFLGNRGIRLCLNNPHILEQQLEAILRAAAGQTVKIMLPMITSIHEMEATRSILQQVQQRLRTQGDPHCQQVQLGIMIETPASAIMADAFAKHCDFFSIGTNDLTQYVMSADRGNAQVQSCYNPCHPAVIRMLANTIQAGAAAGIEVSVCGDLAADLRFTKLLLGLGLKKFSVPLPMVGRLKYKIGKLDGAKAQAFAKELLTIDDETKIKQLLEQE